MIRPGSFAWRVLVVVRAAVLFELAVLELHREADLMRHLDIAADGRELQFMAWEELIP